MWLDLALQMGCVGVDGLSHFLAAGGGSSAAKKCLIL